MTSALPTLRTDRLVLEPVGAAALPALLPRLVELNSDPEVMRFLLGRAATREETAAEWAERLDARTDAECGLGYWIGSVEGRFVGWWSSSAYAPDPSCTGIGYRLRRDEWGRGLATEGARAVLAHAFALPGVETAFATTMAVNSRSRAVLEKLGMTHVDTLHHAWPDPLPGSELGEVVYEVRRASP